MLKVGQKYKDTQLGVEQELKAINNDGTLTFRYQSWDGKWHTFFLKRDNFEIALRSGTVYLIEHNCKCSLDQLMLNGCKCGGK